MRTLLIVAAALLIVACGSSPTAPTEPPIQPPVVSEPSATLSITVMSNFTRQPILGVPVSLIRPGSVSVNPYDALRTDANGRASWHVTVPETYTVLVRDQPITSRVSANAGWLVSLPE